MSGVLHGTGSPVSGAAPMRGSIYQYFDYSLPPLVQHLCIAPHVRLAPIANRCNRARARGRRHPERHADFLADYHVQRQRRSTPLIPQYEAGDYSCLQQDL